MLHRNQQRKESIERSEVTEMDKMSMKEIETKQRAILNIKRIRKGLSEQESHLLKDLDKKYRDAEGRLLKGSFFINSDSKWMKVCI